MDREEEAYDANEDVELPEGREEGRLSDLLSKTRGILGNSTPESARERSGEERNASNVTRGTRSGAGEVDDAPNGEALRKLSERHVEQARQSNELVEEVIRDENEALSQSAGPVMEALNPYLAQADEEIEDELIWDYNPGRSLEAGDEEIDNLASYLSDRSAELDDIFGKITTVNSSIDAFRGERNEIEDALEEKREEKHNEGERVLRDKQDRMTASEAREAEIDDIVDFAMDVSEINEASIQQDIDQLEEKKSELDRRVDSLEDAESALEDARDSVVDEIEEVYEPHAEEMESLSQEVAGYLEDDLGMLEDLAGMTVPNLTEEQGTKHVDDAANDIQNAREEAAYGLIERIDAMAYSLSNISEEHEDLVDLLPEQYLEDGEFPRIDDSTDLIVDLEEELSGDYDSLEDRVSDAYEEATGEGLYQSIDDAESTLSHLRAAHSDEVAE